MGMAQLLVLVVVAVTPVPWPAGPMSQRAATLATSQRLEAFTLPVAASTPVNVDLLDARVTLPVEASQVAAVVGALRGRSVLCPHVRAQRSAVQLGCVGPQVTARLWKRGNNTVLVLRELKGVPVHHRDLLLPEVWELMAQEARCDSNAVLDRALCQLRQGRTAAGLKLLGQARRRGVDRATASVILGSLAEQRGEDAKALAWYRQAVGANQWLALVRVVDCELGGACGPLLTGRPGASLNALPPRLKDLVALRRARVMALRSPTPELGAVMLAQAVEHGSSMHHPCIGQWRTCHAVLAHSLQGAGSNAQAATAAVESYLKVVVGEDRTALQLRAASLAARRMEELGAPGPAALLLSAHTPLVEKRALEDHLATTVRLYLDAGENARASTVRLYATGVLPASRLRAQPWTTLDARLAQDGASPPQASASSAADAEAQRQASQRRAAMDLAVARTLTARARINTALAVNTSGN